MGRGVHEQKPLWPLRTAPDLPRRAAPQKGSSDTEPTPDTLATPRTSLHAGGWLWPPGTEHLELLLRQNKLLFPQAGGEGCPSLPAQGAQRGTAAPNTSQKLSRIHLCTLTPWQGWEAVWPPRALARGERGRWYHGRSWPHRDQRPRQGMDLVPALLSTDELRAVQRVFRNQNRMFPGCQPAAQGYQA